MLPQPEVIEYLDDLPSEFLGSAFATLREWPASMQRASVIEVLQPSSPPALLLARKLPSSSH